MLFLCGTYMYCLSLLHKFIRQSLNSSSNPAGDVSENKDDGNLRQSSQLRPLWMVNHCKKQFIPHHRLSTATV